MQFFKKYRNSSCKNSRWVLLSGSFSRLLSRLGKRLHHFQCEATGIVLYVFVPGKHHRYCKPVSCPSFRDKILGETCYGDSRGHDTKDMLTGNL